MKRDRRQFGFTLVEVLVALVVVLILISATARLGQFVRQRSSERLAASALAVIDIALQQYHNDFDAFPFYSWDVDENGRPDEDDFGKTELRWHISQSMGGDVVSIAPELVERDGKGDYHSFASSVGLYWFLYRSPSGRPMVEALAAPLISTRHPHDATLQLTATVGGDVYDLPRFIDPWGTSLWYRYEDGYSFPRVISAGPDRVFGTPDDIENK